MTTEKNHIEILIADRSIPITYRNMFKAYLKWRDEEEAREDKEIADEGLFLSEEILVESGD